RCGSSISLSQLRDLVKRLRGHSYDVKAIPAGGKLLYAMVRTADITSETYYKPLGNIQSTCIQSSDWHVGSKTFSKKAFELMLEDIEDNSISDLMIDGDLIQSLGVHRLELADVSIWDATEQVLELVDLLTMIPKDVNIHFVLGNHEEKLKNQIQVGYDALNDAVSKMNERGFHNCNYYGSVANLTMDDDYTYLMMHTAGGVTYATSYRVERTWHNLIQRPNMYHTGHSHQLMHLSKAPHHELVISGTLQRENAWLMNKGLTSQVGWLLMRGYSPERCNIERVSPRVF
ncbi:metallophosphoesterase, partial [Patescibacteria group bacterium]|nr:metallophosphoesterase [Patescibacteria group bacterium]